MYVIAKFGDWSIFQDLRRDATIADESDIYIVLKNDS